MTGYDFHPEAEQDLDEISEFVASYSLDAAEQLADEIIAALESLVRFPYQGHTRPDLTSRPLRFWRVRDYLIVYAPDKRPLWIVAVLHGRRSPRVMAAILRDRET